MGFALQLARAQEIDFLTSLAALQPSVNLFKQGFSAQVKDIGAHNKVKLAGAGKKAGSFLEARVRR